MAAGRRPVGGIEAMVGRVGMSQKSSDKPAGGGIMVDNRPPPPKNVDAGVHPAVAAMRASGSKKAPLPEFSLSMLGLGKREDLSTKRKAAEPAGEEKEPKQKKKKKKSKKDKDKRKKDKKSKKDRGKSKKSKKEKGKHKSSSSSDSSSSNS
eukprot:CAMPEP_0169144666 /NCGR_PEP_ID=MMETSP1015-20121227/46421_1 /TAXON_ID=342587 /ORGANISM="Karlodinium micrum, Strain CCMP2283" /LENGTH=150 /DNA_ID=CAMNT_0009212047 /DNA_START=54 /DNA_END=506 /DNA_ORIENTATION=+